MPGHSTRRQHARRGQDEREQPLDLPRQAPIYAQNPFGVPAYTPAGWRRRPLREWSRAGKWSLAAIVTAMALPLIAIAVARLLGG